MPSWPRPPRRPNPPANPPRAPRGRPPARRPARRPPARPSPGRAPRGKSADEMLSDLLRPPPQATGGPGGATVLTPPPGPLPVDKTTGPGAVIPAAPAITVLREGSIVADRTGRLTRTADGSQWEFSFE